MKMLSKLAALATIATLAVIPSAHAQMDWDGAWIAGGEIYMTDNLGNGYWADPYAESAWVDSYGNVMNDYSGTFDDSGLSWNQLTPDTSMGCGSYDTGYSSTYVPYENPVDSHQSFINSIWE